MLDIKLIRENSQMIEENLKKRGDEEKINILHRLITLDKERRELIQKGEKLKAQRNQITKEIAELKKAGQDDSKKMDEVRKIPDEIKATDMALEEISAQTTDILMSLPNILHDSVPFGKDDSDNVEVKRVGLAPKFDFTPKNHLELVEGLDLIDSERAARIAGRGFFYLKNDLALLDMALSRYAIDILMKRGYTLIVPPYMMCQEAYKGVTDLGAFSDVLYKIEGEDLHLIATAEHPMAAMFKDEVLLSNELPIKFVGFSPCFRKEVGAHGKYTKGLFRMHQFHKVEQFIFCVPDQSWDFHEELQKNAQDLYDGLGLHYRVVNVCTGDIGDIAAKKYDIEGWMADGNFRELGSNSNCTDYQARRLNIKYREKDGQSPAGFIHTLNNTALATSRTMIAVLEQYQQKNGSIKIPYVLQPYMGNRKTIGPSE
jgi:seryl-tRNA synthetase